jgi:hypothetical protein
MTDINDAIGNILIGTQMLEYLILIKDADINNTCFDYNHNTHVNEE